ncbi:MAG: FHA domain-containing protein, partial [Planctomycetota bacterium]|nr:FHA domain-containing protein [Planctomycetota bacterium]
SSPDIHRGPRNDTFWTPCKGERIIMVELTLTFERRPINTFKFDKDVILIGRDPTCDVRIDNVGVSRHHARIEKRDNIYSVSDLGSGNGTFVRGQRVTQHNLNDGDEITIWNFSIFFKLPEAEKPKVVEITPQKIDIDATIAIDRKQLELRQKERSSALLAHLSYTDPKKGVQTFSIMKTSTFFGKSPKCEFQIGGFFTQHRHASIIRDEIGFRFINFGNRSRGMINDQEVDDYRLKNGDVIKIVSRTFKFNEGLPHK